MSLQTPLEGLLRPPIEWMSTFICLTVAGVLLACAGFFMLPLIWTAAGALGLIAFGLWRFKQGYRVFRYQCHLREMPTYAMAPSQLPVSQQQLFLGRGFLWTPAHTQRLRDLDLDYNLHYRYSSKLFQRVKTPDISGEPCLHGVSETENDINMTLIERTGHTVVIGTTGVGKTRLAELLIAQDIHRGDVVIVLDPKGDTDLLQRIHSEAKLAGRESSLLVFHLGFPEFSARYNPIGHFTKITQVATRITNALPSTGEAAAFREFTWKFVNLVARAFDVMKIVPTYKLINYYITRLQELLLRYCEEVMSKKDSDYRAWIKNFIATNVKKDKNGVGVKPTQKEAILAYVEQVLESRQNIVESDLLSDLSSACRLDRTYYDKITASVGPLLEKLNTGPVAELLSPIENKKNIFYQSVNEDRFGHAEMKLIEQNDVLNLPKGQAFCLLEGGKLYKIRIPLPAKE